MDLIHEKLPNAPLNAFIKPTICNVANNYIMLLGGMLSREPNLQLRQYDIKKRKWSCFDIDAQLANPLAFLIENGFYVSHLQTETSL